MFALVIVVLSVAIKGLAAVTCQPPSPFHLLSQASFDIHPTCPVYPNITTTNMSSSRKVVQKVLAVETEEV